MTDDDPSDRRPESEDRNDDPLARLMQLELELPERGTGARTGRRPLAAPAAEEPVRRAPSRRWMTVFASVLALAVVAGAALTWVGVQTVRDSTTGRSVAISDPSEPGFEALLEPTPTLLVAHEGDDGSLVSLALLSLGRHDTGGSVVIVPPDTVVATEDFTGSLAFGYLHGGPDGIFQHVQDLLGVAIFELAVVDDAQWQALTAGVAPIAVANPDPVDGFDSGAIEISADRVDDWLAAKDDGESDLARQYRISTFWTAWLAAVQAAEDPSVVPGEIDSGLGRYVRGIAGGVSEVATLPVLEEALESGDVVFEIDPAPAAELVARAVPYPRGSVPGARTRVRLLDGTGSPDHALAAAPLLVPAGAEIVIVGNAEAFEQPRDTEVRYHDPAQRPAAERLREALGAGRVVEDARQVDSFDVTIVLGTDV